MSGLNQKVKPLGILGGGQLARMLALRAHSLGIPVAVLSENADDPAAQVVRHWREAKLDDRVALRKFLNECSTVTFESEFLDAKLLGEVEKQSGTKIFPRPQLMALLQDRLPQKQLLIKNNLPTLDFIEVNSISDARDAFNKWPSGVVFKKRRFGYDGYGTYVVRNEHDLANFNKSIQTDTGFIAEPWTIFKREIATMIARGQDGSCVHLPFVETRQEDSRCLWVKGPISTPPGLIKKLLKFLAAIDYVGIMGVELFDTKNGFIINELAPRVHNSGHYSLDALSDDQFAIHLKAVSGLKLETPIAIAPAFAMYNLLGHSEREPSWRTKPGFYLHWYGKLVNRPGRKMGHVNAIGRTPTAAFKKLEAFVRENFKL